MNSSFNKEPRHPKGKVSTISINLVHLRNPWVIAFWSAMLPGFGHVSLGSYIPVYIWAIWSSYRQSVGHSLLDGGAMLGTVFMLFGVMWGFLWKFGPILGGITGFALGVSVGFALDYFNSKRSVKKDKAKNLTTEVILVVNCEQSEVKMVEAVLWNHLATSIGRVKRS